MVEVCGECTNLNVCLMCGLEPAGSIWGLVGYTLRWPLRGIWVGSPKGASWCLSPWHFDFTLPVQLIHGCAGECTGGADGCLKSIIFQTGVVRSRSDWMFVV